MTETDDPAVIDIDDRAEGRLAEAQKWRCCACGRDLSGGGATLVIATPAGMALVVPILVHQLCIDDLRRVGFDAMPGLGKDDKNAARTARQGALALALEPARGAAEQASRRADAAEQRATDAERQTTEASRRADAAETRAADAKRKTAEAARRAEAAEKRAADAERQAAEAANATAAANKRAADAERELESERAVITELESYALDHYVRLARDSVKSGTG